LFWGAGLFVQQFFHAWILREMRLNEMEPNCDFFIAAFMLIFIDDMEWF